MNNHLNGVERRELRRRINIAVRHRAKRITQEHFAALRELRERADRELMQAAKEEVKETTKAKTHEIGHMILGDGEPRPLKLSPMEFKLYEVLVSDPYRIFTIQQLTIAIERNAIYLRVLVYTLRRKLAAQGIGGVYSVPYYGYSLRRLTGFS